MKNKEPREELLLFAPKSDRGLRIDYPELSGIKEFESLRKNEMLFVWYYGCKSSPYFNLDWKETDIIKKCVEKSQLNVNKEFLEGKFPDKIKSAVLVMNRFEPALRIIARQEAAKTLLDNRKLTSLILDNEGNNIQFQSKEGDVDFMKKKHYQKMLSDASADLPVLIQRAEQGFGLTEKSKSKVEDKNLDDGGKSFAETYHEH